MQSLGVRTVHCVHPKDPRYTHLIGKHAFVPMINRRIPIIADDYIEIEFGTGALKVTPAHDINDFQLGQKHGHPVSARSAVRGAGAGDHCDSGLVGLQRSVRRHGRIGSGRTRGRPPTTERRSQRERQVTPRVTLVKSANA